MNSDNTQNYINAVGALAEATTLFYKQLIAHGLPQDVTEKAVLAFIATSFTPHQKEEQNDD